MAESSVTSNPEPNSLSWASSEEYDGGFRDGERGTDRRELLQLFPGANPFCIAEVDRTENDVEFPAWFDINLDRRLSVQFDGDVDDMASFEKTLRRSIRPSAGQIDTHRATAPDDLVGMDREPGFPFPSGRRADDGFTEQAERL